MTVSNIVNLLSSFPLALCIGMSTENFIKENVRWFNVEAFHPCDPFQQKNILKDWNSVFSRQISGNTEMLKQIFLGIWATHRTQNPARKGTGSVKNQKILLSGFLANALLLLFLNPAEAEFRTSLKSFSIQYLVIKSC